MEAILLAGGKAERLGEAAGGKPKTLVEVAGRPLGAYQIGLLAQFGVERVIVSCAAGQENLFESELAIPGIEVTAVGEPEPLGRGGGIRYAASAREEEGDVFALNGDELLDVDLIELLDAHRSHEAAATIVIAPLPTAFGVVDVDDAGRVRGFEDSPKLPYWAHAGVNVLGQEALTRLPERGDMERTTLPELAAERRLYAFRHPGVWLTVNTPKDLRVAEEYIAAHPQWLASVRA
jgi:NDP-sugar pyrophosphorylase family protein